MVDERGILVHHGKSIFGIFEILKHYGTSWKINILESPSTYRFPPLHPTTLLGDTIVPGQGPARLRAQRDVHQPGVLWFLNIPTRASVNLNNFQDVRNLQVVNGPKNGAYRGPIGQQNLGDFRFFS